MTSDGTNAEDFQAAPTSPACSPAAFQRDHRPAGEPRSASAGGVQRQREHCWASEPTRVAQRAAWRSPAEP